MQTMSPSVDIASHEALQQTLVDLAALATYTKQAHWNISGPNFMSVHLYLDQLTDMLRDAADVVGERIAAIGASPDARAVTVSECTTLTTIPAGDLEIPPRSARLDVSLTDLIEAIATADHRDERPRDRRPAHQRARRPRAAPLVRAVAALTRKEGRPMTSTHEQVAVLGIGAMGHGMATSARRAGIPTVVWNRDPGKARDLVELGAQLADSAADAARLASIVVTMVTDREPVLSIARDEGMLAALAPGSIWVQMSTIGVAGLDEVAAMVVTERPDVTLVDAPVSGSKDPAAQGRLTIFASGPDVVRSRLAPLFDALGERTIWLGAVGAGTRLKLVNNIWLAFSAEAVDASIALAQRLGLETDDVVDALSGGPLVSPWQAAKLQRIVHGDYSAQFALSLALKDMRLALEADDAAGFSALAGLADEWQQVADRGLGDQDLTVVTQALAQQGANP